MTQGMRGGRRRVTVMLPQKLTIKENGGEEVLDDDEVGSANDGSDGGGGENAESESEDESDSDFEEFGKQTSRRLAESTLYKEDQYDEGHTQVWGSFYDFQQHLWGYACCR